MKTWRIPDLVLGGLLATALWCIVLLVGGWEPNLLTTVGVSAATGAAAAFGLMKFVTEKWIDARVSQELERLRHRINVLMDRTAKLHQHEFEVLPEAWDRLSKAFSDATNFTGRHQRYPDLQRMVPDELEAFLNKSDLLDGERVEVRNADDRNAAYQQMIFRHRLGDVAHNHAEFHNYFISKGVFIQADLKEKIRNLSDMMYDAFEERRLDWEHPMPGEGRFEKGDRLHDEGRKLYVAIEREIQARLWDADKLE